MHSNLGICPQQDILWPNLTATEHLRLFASLKGLDHCEIEEEVSRILELVDLHLGLHVDPRLGRFGHDCLAEHPKQVAQEDTVGEVGVRIADLEAALPQV